MRSRNGALVAAVSAIALLAVAVGGILAGRRSGQDPLTVPGKGEIRRVARFGSEAWAIVLKDSGYGTNLLRIPAADTGMKLTVVPDGATVVTAADGLSAAYGTEPSKFGGARIQGGKVVFVDAQPGGREVQLDRPEDWAVQVLGLVGETVYFQSNSTFEGTETFVYSWNVANGEVTRITGVDRPSEVNRAGTAAATFEQAGTGSCSAYVDLASGLRRWRTCEYRLSRFEDSTAFTPRGATVIYGPPKSDGNGDQFVATVDAASGRLTREWSGPTFQGTTAEDDDHLLIRASSDGKSAIIRCSITTGTCELATALARTDLLLGS